MGCLCNLFPCFFRSRMEVPIGGGIDRDTLRSFNCISSSASALDFVCTYFAAFAAYSSAVALREGKTYKTSPHLSISEACIPVFLFAKLIAHYIQLHHSQKALFAILSDSDNYLRPSPDLLLSLGLDCSEQLSISQQEGRKTWHQNPEFQGLFSLQNNQYMVWKLFYLAADTIAIGLAAFPDRSKRACFLQFFVIIVPPCFFSLSGRISNCCQAQKIQDAALNARRLPPVNL